MEQEIKFCTTKDGVRIAYATIGRGPVIVKAPNWFTHLEYEWQNPVWRHWWEALAQDHALIRFDQRGSGLSDWNVEDTSFEAWVSDLEAVVDAAGLDDFVLLGISQGGAVAVEYAVRHPQKVAKLILYGAYARGALKLGRPTEEFEAQLTLVRTGWGRDEPSYRMLFTSQFMPSASLEQMQWFNELQRISTDGENAARVQYVASSIDVLDRLTEVTTPTLVLHVRDDIRVRYAAGQQVASLIPNSHFVMLPGNNHLITEHEPAWELLLNNVRNFLDTGEPLPEDPRPLNMPVPLPSLLTPRETEVLGLMAAGRTNQEIAAELVISINTVTNHVKNILGKTGTNNRTEAAAFAHRARLTAAS
jgi:pimeloyl-ACP methyl ester carboxylesterase/DNA-binding CsgD family transcriptional regulator